MSAIKMSAFKVIYVRWTLTEDFSLPCLWNCILCSLTSAVPLCVEPTVQEFKPTCWVELIAFSMHWAMIPRFICHWQTLVAPESHITSYLSILTCRDKFSIEVQNLGNMRFITHTGLFIFDYLSEAEKWIMSDPTVQWLACVICVICKDFVWR